MDTPAPDTQSAPTKEQIRAYLERRAHEHAPPPSLEEIRRQLGWHLVPKRGDPR